VLGSCYQPLGRDLPLSAQQHARNAKSHDRLFCPLHDARVVEVAVGPAAEAAPRSRSRASEPRKSQRCQWHAAYRGKPQVLSAHGFRGIGLSVAGARRVMPRRVLLHSTPRESANFSPQPRTSTELIREVGSGSCPRSRATEIPDGGAAALFPPTC